MQAYDAYWVKIFALLVNLLRNTILFFPLLPALVKENFFSKPYLRAHAISKLVKDVADIFLLKEPEMLRGEFDTELLALSQYASVLEDIRCETKIKVINHPDVVSTRIAGHEILVQLFNQFANAVLSKGDKAEFLKQMIPQQYLFGDRGSIAERADSYDKILQVTDFISGMTDSYATNLFKKLKGISL